MLAVAGIVILFNLSTFHISSLFTSSQQIPPIVSYSKIPTPTLYVSSTPPPFPDFSQAPVQPRNIFDLSKWKQFDDQQVGVRFKYPPEWGTPVITYRQGGTSGMFYNVHFPHSYFSVTGESADFSEARDGSPGDFKGFSTTETSFGWINPETYCTNNTFFVFCQTTLDKVDMLSEPRGYFQYMRFEYLNRPGKVIGGLSFGGYFLSQTYDMITSWFYMQNNDYATAHLQEFNNAIIQRKLDATSIKTFDEYEKVFETIENY